VEREILLRYPKAEDFTKQQFLKRLLISYIIKLEVHVLHVKYGNYTPNRTILSLHSEYCTLQSNFSVLESMIKILHLVNLQTKSLSQLNSSWGLEKSLDAITENILPLMEAEDFQQRIPCFPSLVSLGCWQINFSEIKFCNFLSNRIWGFFSSWLLLTNLMSALQNCVHCRHTVSDPFTVSYPRRKSNPAQWVGNLAHNHLCTTLFLL